VTYRAAGTCRQQPKAENSQLGIDLGLKDFTTLSTGEKIEARRIYGGAQQALAIAQRANKKRRVKAIRAQIANRRNDFRHKLSTRIVREFDYIAVGNVNAAGLAKTRMAKSVLDAGWLCFRNQLAFKAVKHGLRFDEQYHKALKRAAAWRTPNRRPRWQKSYV
jgi:IS605 OrfB family transposase